MKKNFMATVLDNKGDTFDRYTIVDHATGNIWGGQATTRIIHKGLANIAGIYHAASTSRSRLR